MLHSSRAPGDTCLSALLGGTPGSPADPVNNSKGCGGVMRAAPFGLWPSIPAVDAFALARDAAALTHGHPSGHLSAGALAYIVRRLLDHVDLPQAVDESLTELARHPGHDETTRSLRAAVDLAASGAPTPERVETLGGGWVGEQALAIGVYAALVAPAPTDVRRALLLAVNHSGDSDSTGAITGNLLGAQHGVAALPVDLLMDLEARHLITCVADDMVREATAPPPAGDARWRERYPG